MGRRTDVNRSPPDRQLSNRRANRTNSRQPSSVYRQQAIAVSTGGAPVIQALSLSTRAATYK
jgi:hypothetical protein